MYKKNKFVFFSMMLMILSLGTLSFRFVIDNDFWFLYDYGKEILTNGFVKIDPFTMHEGLTLIIQQWVTDVIFYLTYSNFGPIGIRILYYVLLVLSTFLFYNTLNLIGKNCKINFLLTLVQECIVMFTISTRPSIFTYLIIVSLINVVLRYIKTKNYKWLFLLPLISIIQINFHASMWPFLFVFMLPFLLKIDKFPFYDAKFDEYKKIPLLISAGIMFICGFLNPYTYKNVLYLYYSTNKYQSVINEMHAPNLDGKIGTLFFVVLVMIIICIFLIKKNYNLRYIFLLLGGICLGLYAYRTLTYAFMCYIIFCSHMFEDTKFCFKSLFKHYKAMFPIYILMPLILFNTTSFCEKNDTQKAVDYLTKNYNVENAKVYTNYHIGSYAEYKGIKPYIDPRMEVYVKKYNNKKDIWGEYIKLQYDSNCYYKDFFDKYDFDYVFVDDTEYFYTIFKHEKDYKEIYSNKTVSIYEKNKE